MSKIEKYKVMVKDIVRTKELLELTKLSKDFNKVRDSTLSLDKKINILINTILKATSYEERLTELKIRLMRIKSQVNKEKLKARNDTMQSKKFFSMSKKDQEFLMEKEAMDIYQVLRQIDSNLEIIEQSNEYVRSANFNMKATLSTLKEYIHVEK